MYCRVLCTPYEYRYDIYWMYFEPSLSFSLSTHIQEVPLPLDDPRIGSRSPSLRTLRATERATLKYAAYALSASRLVCAAWWRPAAHIVPYGSLLSSSFLSEEKLHRRTKLPSSTVPLYTWAAWCHSRLASEGFWCDDGSLVSGRVCSIYR